jgi:hypothetical protein
MQGKLESRGAYMYVFITHHGILECKYKGISVHTCNETIIIRIAKGRHCYNEWVHSWFEFVQNKPFLMLFVVIELVILQ